MGSRRSAGHLAALFTIIIWGTTFISTKVLLTDFRPVEITRRTFFYGILFMIPVLFLFDFTACSEIVYCRIGLERLWRSRGFSFLNTAERRKFPENRRRNPPKNRRIENGFTEREMCHGD